MPVAGGWGKGARDILYNTTPAAVEIVSLSVAWTLAHARRLAWTEVHATSIGRIRKLASLVPESETSSLSGRRIRFFGSDGRSLNPSLRQPSLNFVVS